jgi:hypothetical protein
MQHLVSRDLSIPPHPGTSWWDAAMTDRVALWATQTADEMFAELTRQLGVREDGPGWQQTWAWR